MRTLCQDAGVDIGISSSGSERDVISEGPHWSSIRPPSRLHGCRRTASPALPLLVDVSGEYSFASRETPEGSLTSSCSVAIEVPCRRPRGESALVGVDQLGSGGDFHGPLSTASRLKWFHCREGASEYGHKSTLMVSAPFQRALESPAYCGRPLCSLWSSSSLFTEGEEIPGAFTSHHELIGGHEVDKYCVQPTPQKTDTKFVYSKVQIR